MASRYLAFTTKALLLFSSFAPAEAHTHVHKRDLVIPIILPGNWSSQDCYVDVGRTLTGPNYNNITGMTTVSCIAYCDSQGFIYAGTEYSYECFCGNSIAASATNASNVDCQSSCSGDVSESCGGANRLNLFWSGSSGPQVNPGSGLWSYVGCYTEGKTGRLLPNEATTIGAANMTIDLCLAACQAGGYNLAGTEYAQECWCGNSFSNSGTIATNPDCSSQCAGNKTELCGGASRLSVYNFNNTLNRTSPTSSSATEAPFSTPTAPSIVPTVGSYVYYGCQTEATVGRALNSNSTASDSMSLEYCAAWCVGHTLFGAEYGRECYCGNTFSAGSTTAPSSDCSFSCANNASEFCGAGNRLSVYQLNGTTVPAPTSVTPTPTPTPSPLILPLGWSSQGCWVDGVKGRILTYQQPDNPDNTIEGCISTCSAGNYTVSGLEYGVQCFCDTIIRNGGTNTTDSDCFFPCSGNSDEICGAGNRLSIYSIGTPSVLPAPVVQVRDLPSSWEYQGCLEDNKENIRTFPWEIINIDNNTATNCLSQCQAFGYNAAGLEYGVQCFCGDTANIDTVGATLVDSYLCNVVCSGNLTHYCGGDNLLSYYAWTGPPLYAWDFRTGPKAGEYGLLIGGVCIPLMTSQMVTGKVTFVEKFGTGEPNSTGAYELDLASISNFTQAWRPMHVKTDVFCSGGLILPDKAGRQIDVGGWSGISNYGVRLYWPDGGEGVWGANDWQENVDESSLQVPRWYPSVMIMANGSILVVGGETGSNAPPSPSIEILPATGTEPVYLDFLDRTDPNNLYPFLAVLPGGGILIVYYNEAKILDEGTFQTVRQLPNVPGAVNDFEAGRNYPLEGTMVLLPQWAPYVEGLGVLICGGSTPGGGYALDNCVSIGPEAEEPVWVIERMPSLRVMPCIAALPDGTYLVLNGAQHGTAGFGLGSNPNLNALLYDPSKDVNTRFSVMANTSVARLYHSEAILLADGRIMVSGSDPQDGVHPEEYRVEVFTPPYLLSRIPQPTFNLSSTDWAYGETVSFNITSNLTALSNETKVSLLGAVVSTHGNSMGQRTIFPEFSCNFTSSADGANTNLNGTGNFNNPFNGNFTPSGNFTGNFSNPNLSFGNSTSPSNFTSLTIIQCTVTSPPNAHICPPGWFLMFVLDGLTPSIGTFVRIGKDPAGLGDWPAFEDFDVPGV